MSIKVVSFVGSVVKNIARKGFRSSDTMIKPISTSVCDTVKISSQAIRKRVKKVCITPSIESLKTDKKVLEQIFKLESFDDFLVNTRKVICKQLGIPLSLYPDIINIGERSSGAFAEYVPTYNQIWLPDTTVKFFNNGIEGKKRLWGLLVHELEHARQNFQILSTPSLADRAVKTHSQKFAEINLQVFKIAPIEEIEIIMKKMPDGSRNKLLLENIVDARKNTKFTPKIEQELLRILRDEGSKIWNDMLEKVKNFIEPILPNTKKEKVSKKLFMMINNPVDYDKHSSLFDKLKYYLQLHEILAYCKQLYALGNLKF